MGRSLGPAWGALRKKPGLTYATAHEKDGSAVGHRARARFGVDESQGTRFNVAKLEPLLADIHERLAGVTIEQLTYGEFIRRYDRTGMLFYPDPPYWGCEKDYGQDVFRRSDFNQLPGIKGKFLLSINDTLGVRATFAAFHMIEVDTACKVTAGAAVKAAELVILNFRPG